jgi:uncharacterized membrane protein YkoI
MHRVFLLAFVMLVAPVTTAIAGPGQPPATRKTPAEAEALALQVVPGTVVESELEKERGRWVYSVDIRPARGGEVEVLIDAESGATVAVEEDGDDDDDDGAGCDQD